MSKGSANCEDIGMILSSTRLRIFLVATLNADALTTDASIRTTQESNTRAEYFALGA